MASFPPKKGDTEAERLKRALKRKPDSPDTQVVGTPSTKDQADGLRAPIDRMESENKLSGGEIVTAAEQAEREWRERTNLGPTAGVSRADILARGDYDPAAGGAGAATKAKAPQRQVKPVSQMTDEEFEKAAPDLSPFTVQNERKRRQAAKKKGG